MHLQGAPSDIIRMCFYSAPWLANACHDLLSTSLKREAFTPRSGDVHVISWSCREAGRVHDIYHLAVHRGGTSSPQREAAAPPWSAAVHAIGSYTLGAAHPKRRGMDI